MELEESKDLMAMLQDINKDSLNEKKLKSYLKLNYDDPNNKLTAEKSNFLLIPA